MTYLIDIRLEQEKKRTYRIEASNEEEAKERLLLRLPPSQRASIIIDTIQIDVNSLKFDDIYGSFGGE